MTSRDTKKRQNLYIEAIVAVPEHAKRQFIAYMANSLPMTASPTASQSVVGHE